MAREERGFFGKAMVFLLTVFAVIGLIAMSLSVVCPYVNPNGFVWLAFFGLAFWEIFLLMFYWIGLKLLDLLKIKYCYIDYLLFHVMKIG